MNACWTNRFLWSRRFSSLLSGSTATTRTSTPPFLLPRRRLIVSAVNAATVSTSGRSSSSTETRKKDLRLFGSCVKPRNIHINLYWSSARTIRLPPQTRGMTSSSSSWPIAAADAVVGNQQEGSAVTGQRVLSFASAVSSNRLSTTADVVSSQRPEVMASQNGWCCTAELRVEDETIEIKRLAGYPQEQLVLTNNLLGSIHIDDSSKSTELAPPKLPPLPLQPATATTISPPPLDLTQASDWMEYMELLQVQQQQQYNLLDTGTTTTDGAYDTLRCDLILVSQPASNNYNPTGGGSANLDAEDIGSAETRNRWNVWGQDFHLDRLERSFLSLIHHHQHRTKNYDDSHKTAVITDGEPQQKMVLQQARNVSVRMLHALLDEASRADTMKMSAAKASSTSEANDDASASTTATLEGSVIQLVRLTWLWSAAAAGTATASLPSCAANPKQILPNVCNSNSSTGPNKIVVRAHAVSSTQPFSVRQPVKPITCTIAADQQHQQEQQECQSDAGDDNKSDITVNAPLPSRGDNPQSKVASWTRLRKNLENPETYKPAGVAEVLLVRPTTEMGHEEGVAATTGLELLEGLSSNLFVLYKNEEEDETPLTLRTAHYGVLHGYVRHLLDVAETSDCGIRVSHEPILLQDVHRWKEAFITSSSRLIVPISRLLLHDGFRDNGRGIVEPVFREFWRDQRLSPADGLRLGIGGGKQPPIYNEGIPQQVEKPKWQALLDEILRRGGYG